MKTTLKQTIAMVVVCAILFSFCGCTQQTENSITIATPRDPGSLDWQCVNTMNASPIFTNITESLLRYNEKGELVPACAEEYEVSSDGLVYTFTLRSNLKWSNGDRLEAKDFVDSWLHAINPNTSSMYADVFLDYVKNAKEFYEGRVEATEVGFSAPNERTITITLSAPITYFPEIVALWTYAPVHMPTISDNPKEWATDPHSIISNGPFIIESMVHGSEYVLVKNNNYWDSENVKLDKVTIKVMPEAQTSVMAMETKSIDGILSVPSTIAFNMINDNNKELFTTPSFGSSHLIFNCSTGVFQNKKIRQAFSVAVDREKIVNALLKTGEKPGDGLIPPGYMINGNDYSDGNNYKMKNANAEMARNLLIQEGYSDASKLGTIRLLVYTDTVLATISEYLKYTWETELGAKVEIVTQDWSAHYEDILNSEYEIAAFGYSASIFHPMDFFDGFRTGHANNASKYSCSEYDALVDKIRVEINSQKNENLMRDAEDLLMNDYPVIILYHNVRHTLMDSKVDNWYLTPMNALNLKYANVE